MSMTMTMTMGDRTLDEDPASYFVMSIDLPAVRLIHTAETGNHTWLSA